MQQVEADIIQSWRHLSLPSTVYHKAVDNQLSLMNSLNFESA
jgi:hypothetical protein